MTSALRQITHSSSSTGTRLERLGPAFELYTMRADGHHVRRITHNRVPDLRPDWRAIGKGSNDE